MSGKFKVKSITDVNEFKLGDSITESDYCLLSPEGNFIQFEYESVYGASEKYEVNSGIYTIVSKNMRLALEPTKFTPQPILQEYLVTKDISDKINQFFNKIDVYVKYGLDPKRAMLLYGKPGAGKSQTIASICKDYTKDTGTIAILWPSDKFEARDVKNFFKSFDYNKNTITKMILVIEDLGGVENADGGRRYSESSLLSLLDNVEQTFKIPTMILATTNYPEKFLENLTDRPQRFDDVMEIKTPSGEFRAKFLEFFSQGAASDTSKSMIKDRKYDGFSVAHVKEVVIRSALYDISLEESIESLHKQSSRVKKGFTNAKSGMGIGHSDE